MKDVNIYIQPQIRGPVVKTAKYGFVIEYLENGFPVKTYVEIGCLKDATNKRLVAAAVCQALGKLPGKSRVTIYTDSRYLQNAFMQHWMYEWEASDWKNAKGKNVKNADIWMLIAQKEKIHEISIIYQESHDYSGWLIREMERTDIKPGKSREILPK